MLYSVRTKKSPEHAGKELEAAASRHGFGVLAVHDLPASMAKHGVKFEKTCYIYEVCQPQRAKEVLEANTAVATALPCRIAIYEEDAQTSLAMIKPTALLGLFHKPELEQPGRDVERALTAIIDEAAQAN